MHIYKDQNDKYIKKELKIIQEDKGDLIIRNEFDKALKELNKRKASEIDNLPSELTKNARKME